MDRRNALKRFGLASIGMTALSATATAAEAQSPEPAVKISGQYKYPGVDGKLLVNKARAYRVLDEMKVDGLIAVTPINVHCLSNTISTLTKMHVDYPAFATFPRDPGQTSFFITSTGNASSGDHVQIGGRGQPVRVGERARLAVIGLIDRIDRQRDTVGE